MGQTFQAILLIICVFENDYGICDGEEDIVPFDRYNVVSKYEGDGSIKTVKFENVQITDYHE